MREYAALYDPGSGQSYVILRDKNSNKWYVHTKIGEYGDIHSLKDAEEIAEALNKNGSR